jgi:hypothetical protein
MYAEKRDFDRVEASLLVGSEGYAQGADWQSWEDATKR